MRLSSISVDIPKVSASKVLTNGLNIAYYIIGIVAVGMIVYSGIQYITSNGDAGKAKKAQQTIVYAIVGLIVAVGAYAITNFVITNV
ncbi:MAG: hypothetical protein Q4C83_00140 [Candidatus Saccharibacteria bacterium]|nr:hypothetical protein [Candidatus Saccharibacteria bacterium]